MVDDSLRYHTRKVVGGNVDDSSSIATFRTLYADGFNVRSDGGSVLGRSTTLSETASAATTRAALLTSWISSGRGHWYLRLSGEGRRGLGGLEVSGVGWWGEKKVGRDVDWFYRLSIINQRIQPATPHAHCPLPSGHGSPCPSFHGKRAKEHRPSDDGLLCLSRFRLQFRILCLSNTFPFLFFRLLRRWLIASEHSGHTQTPATIESPQIC